MPRKVFKLQALLRDALAAVTDSPDPNKPIGAHVKMLHGPPDSASDVEAMCAAAEAQAAKAAANAEAQLLAQGGDGEAEAVVAARAAANAAIAWAVRLAAAIRSKSLAPGWPSAPATTAPAEDAAPARPEFGYVVDYRESDGAYRIIFDDIEDAEDAGYWYIRGVDWYKRGVDFEVL